jgi:hypothetical protein
VAITRVQQVSSYSFFPNTGENTALSNAPTPGNLLLQVVLVYDRTVTYSHPNATWELVQRVDGTNDYLLVFRRVAQAGDGADVGASALSDVTQWTTHIAEFSGADPAAFDVTRFGVLPSGTSYSTGAMTTTQPNTYVVLALGNEANPSTTGSFTGGFAFDYEVRNPENDGPASGQCLTGAHKALAAPATVSSGWSYGGTAAPALFWMAALQEPQTGPTIVTGSAALSSTGTLAATGQPEQHGTVLWTGTATWQAEGRGERTGASTFTSTGTLQAQGRLEQQGASLLTGTGTLQAQGFGERTGQVVWAGTATLQAEGRGEQTGQAPLAGTGTFQARGYCELTGQALLTGSGILTATGEGAPLGQVALTGTGTLAATGHPEQHGTLVLRGAATLQATGRSERTGATTLAGTGTLTAQGTLEVRGAVAWSGGGTLHAIPDGTLLVLGAVVLGATAALTATGLVLGAEFGVLTLQVTVPGRLTLTAQARATLALTRLPAPSLRLALLPKG